ncbi:MAG TPA: sulfatase-like hydrolase/transferase [Tepidisphaeraceae bacterium]|nr:sulfatase-like hydrolase/transferase [Tepidisphaeraceae bacterium]
MSLGIKARNRSNEVINASVTKARGVRSVSTFWLAWWMAVIFTVTKLFHLGMPLPYRTAPLSDYVYGVLVATASDNLFALAAGAVAGLSLFALSRWPRAQRTAWYLWLVVFTAFILYAIISAFVFGYTSVPITRPLLRAAGDWGNMRSSVMAFVGPKTSAALIGGPLAYLGLVFLTRWFPGVPRSRAVRIAQGFLIVGILAQFAYARHAQPQWTRRPDHRIALNPHWTLFTSCALGVVEHPIVLPTDIPAEYDGDFLPVRERGATTRPAYALPFETAHRPRHVIVYVLESTSTQFLGLYGSRFKTTPRLESEAAHSIVFDNITCHVGMTPCSLVAINSADYPRPVWAANVYDPSHPLNQPGTLLSEVLKQAGYRTLALTSSDFQFAYQRGYLEGRFDTIWDKRDLGAPELVSWGTADSAMVDKLLTWIDAGKDRAAPFFAMCWTNQTHHPYTLSPGQQEREMGGVTIPPPADGSVVNRYLNVLAEEDRQLGRLIDGIRQRGLADDTLLAIIGDHGEGLNWPHQSLGHGFRIYQENVNVPCILWCPGLFHEKRRIGTVASQIDLAPTLTDILGIAPASTWQGHSLFDPNRPSRAYFYGANNDYLLGMREGDWKYIYNATTGYDELYDLKIDPLEQNDISAQNPKVCHDLRRRVGAWVRHLDEHGAGVKP